MKDNLDVFRNVVFRIPTLRTLIGVLLGGGIVFGVLSTVLLARQTSMQVSLLPLLLVPLLFYILPALLSTEAIFRGTTITREWAALTAIIDEGVLFLFAVVLYFTDSASEAWQVMWLGLATIYFINLLLILMARGREGHTRNLVAGLVFPLSILFLFHLTVGRILDIPNILYLQNSAFFLVSAFLLLLTSLILDFLVKANVKEMSLLDFTSAIVLGDEQELMEGVETDVRQQAFVIDNGEQLQFTVPWLHPGLIAGLGGGKLTDRLIDEDTFMLHVPSDHTLDLADPADISRFETLPETAPETEATRMERVEHGGFLLRGRRYGDTTVIYIENRDLDDYDPAVIEDIMASHDDLVLIDLHNQRIGSQKPQLQHLERRAHHLRDGVAELFQALEEAEQERYRAGWMHGGDHVAVVEEVDREHDDVQRTCLLGINGNDAPESLHRVEEALQEEFDEVLVFTTDTHERLSTLARPKQYTEAELWRAVKHAKNTVTEAEAGFGENTEENVRVLGEDYNRIIFTINIMARLIPITLLLYYIGVVFLVL